ncbi:MAG: glycerol kinase GlpK [Eubacteriales bacterium]|nr:glycerol kinase GlpK [Eubacteriales bacterium]
MGNEKKYVMSLDQGTTSSRCILFDRSGKQVSMAQKEFAQSYPKPGWVEHDAMEIWSSQIGVAQEAIHKIKAEAEDIAAIGITNQRETTLVWDRNTGLPVYPAIVWQCRRTAGFCDEMTTRGVSGLIREKTGLPLDAYFSATKIRWILDHVPGGREKAERREWLFGTVDTWLLWNLTGGSVHATDYSNASRTMLFNIHTLEWDPELLDLFGIPSAMLPDVRPSSGSFGETRSDLFGGAIPIGGVAGDQQAALFGQTCFQKGEAKNTYGTGCFLLMNTGREPVASHNGLLTTIAWGLDGAVTYALEGSIFIAGAAIQWLRDEMGLIRDAAQSERCAREVPDTNGVYFVPAFVGLGAPYWDPYARGTIVGLTRGVNRNHLIRATLEAIAYQTYDVLLAMEEDSGVRLRSLRVDGGACANDFLMQFQSDLIQTEVERPVCIETTALGAAYLAGLAEGFWRDLADIKENWEISGSFIPAVTDQKSSELLDGWHRAVRCAMGRGRT